MAGKIELTANGTAQIVDNFILAVQRRRLESLQPKGRYLARRQHIQQIRCKRVAWGRRAPGRKVSTMVDRQVAGAKPNQELNICYSNESRVKGASIEQSGIC